MAKAFTHHDTAVGKLTYAIVHVKPTKTIVLRKTIAIRDITPPTAAVLPASQDFTAVQAVLLTRAVRCGPETRSLVFD